MFKLLSYNNYISKVGTIQCKVHAFVMNGIYQG